MKKAEKIFAAFQTALCASIIACCIGAIFCLNLSVTPGFYTTDMYADVMAAVQMWEEKTLFPEKWVFGNQLYCFSTPVLAAILYGITGNPFRSMGAAAFLMGLLVLASFDWMLRAAFPRLRDRLVGIAMLLVLPVLFGDAVLKMNGWQLLYTMCAYYACYCVTAFLAFGCYLRSRQAMPWKMLVPTCALCFAMGIQSLRQTAVMILPLAAMEALSMAVRLVRKEKLLTGTLWTAAAVTAANLMGLIAGKMVSVNQVTIFGEIGLAAPDHFAANLWKSLGCAVSLFYEDTEKGNVVYLTVLGAFALLCLFGVLRHEGDGSVRLPALLGLSVLAILGIDVVTTMQIRGIYYFMLYPLLACLSVFLYSKEGKGVKAIVLALLCAGFALSCQRSVEPALTQVKDRSLDIHCQIEKDLKRADITTVYSRWNGSERIAAASHGSIRAGFWTNPEDPFIPVSYLCNPEIYEAAAEHAAYVFYTEEERQAGVRKAEQAGIALTPVCEYPQADISVYTAQVNLLAFDFP